MAVKNEFKFINFWDIILDTDNTINPKYIPDSTDHHLKNNKNTEILEYVLSQI